MRAFYISALVILIFNKVKCDCDTASKTTVLRLKSDLMCLYDKTEGPISSFRYPWNKKVFNVNLITVFKHIKYTNQWGGLMRRRTMEINNLVGVVWIDTYLKWIPKDYDNITKIHMETDEIWAPTIEVVHEGAHIKLLESAHCIVTYNGRVACSAGVVSKAICEEKYFQFWPNDGLVCSMAYSTITYGNTTVKLNMNAFPVFLVGHKEHPQWKLIKIEPFQVKIIYENETYESLKYNFTFMRRPAADIAHTIWPAVGLAVMTLAPTGMPPLGKQRLCISFICIICHIFTINNLYYLLPFFTTMPYIMVFTQISFFWSIIGMICALKIKSMLTFEKSMPPMWLIGISRFAFKLFGEHLYITKDMEPTGYIQLQKVDREERADRYVLFQVIDRTFLVVSFLTYVLFGVIVGCLYASS